MSEFENWWQSKANPANNMPENTREQMKWHMREAFNAGAETSKKTKLSVGLNITRKKRIEFS